MTNHASKLLFGFAAFGLGSAFMYQVVIGDRAGSYLFLGVAVVATLAGLSVQGAVGRDWVPRVEDGSEPETLPVDGTDIGRASPWPFLAALAVGDIAIGAVYGAGWMLLGMGVAAIPAAGWLVQTWREHPAWTPHHGERLTQRLIAPLATPVGTFLIAVFVAVSLSRTLLALPATASWVLALVIAIVLLAVLALLATRPQLSPGLVLGMTGLGVALTVGVGVVGAVAGEREFHPHADGVPEATIDAVDIAFDKSQLAYPPGVRSRLRFVNHDARIWHNVAFYTSKEAGRPLFNGEPILKGDINYSFETPENPGTYYFVCDFHPNMEGELVIEEGAGSSGEHSGEHEAEGPSHEESDH